MPFHLAVCTSAMLMKICAWESRRCCRELHQNAAAALLDIAQAVFKPFWFCSYQWVSWAHMKFLQRCQFTFYFVLLSLSLITHTYHTHTLYTHTLTYHHLVQAVHHVVRISAITRSVPVATWPPRYWRVLSTFNLMIQLYLIISHADSSFSCACIS